MGRNKLNLRLEDHDLIAAKLRTISTALDLLQPQVIRHQLRHFNPARRRLDMLIVLLGFRPYDDYSDAEIPPGQSAVALMRDWIEKPLKEVREIFGNHVPREILNEYYRLSAHIGLLRTQFDVLGGRSKIDLADPF